MTKTQRRVKASQKSISALLTKWRPRLGLDSRWHIDVELYPDPRAWPKKLKGAVACCRTNGGYYQATLRFNLQAIEEDGDTLEHIVLHELVHIVMDPLSLVARDALGESSISTMINMMESTVETVTRALLASQKK